MHALNLALLQGAQINADGTGYAAGYGPGHGGDSNSGGGGGYGGAGGAGSHPGSTGGSPYGTSNEVPLRCGSPGGRGGAGLFGPPGGLVWLELDSQLTLSGLITANGFPPGGLVPSGYGGGGSGGGIYIHCSVLVNTPSGVLQANGGKGGSESGGGGGGRINVWRLYQIGDKTYLGSVMYGQSNGNQSAAGSMGTTYWSMPAYSVFTVQ